ncbi:hypothetical protein [Streptomyces sp. NRRL S-118]|uniref:hypothetical protein n=1 Tax=Streptomyces sp. NRRL S-118 TaxID=1463881 RepID=UPI0004C6AF8E|nr:hypothetical protein [Streptomyces sp. NRRL S-118]
MEGTYRPRPRLEDRMLAETICAAVAAAGLGVAAVAAYRKRFLAAARIVAYALVPLGLVMTGAVEWLARTAFSPVAWAGFGVLGVSWLLFMTTRAVERRRAGRAPQPDAVAPAASAPSLGAGAGGAAGAGSRPAAGRPAREQERAAAPADDFSDIEAILRKHGI